MFCVLVGFLVVGVLKWKMGTGEGVMAGGLELGGGTGTGREGMGEDGEF